MSITDALEELLEDDSSTAMTCAGRSARRRIWAEFEGPETIRGVYAWLDTWLPFDKLDADQTKRCPGGSRVASGQYSASPRRCSGRGSTASSGTRPTTYAWLARCSTPAQAMNGC